MTLSPIVLCHGAGGSARSFDALRPALEMRGLRALSPAYPGRDEVPGPAHATADEIAENLRGRVPPDAGIWLGHSMGGAVAISRALAPSSPLRALVLVSTGARLRVHPMLLEALRDDDRERLYQLFEDRSALDPLVPPATRYADWRAADSFDRMHDVARISCPTLVLVGSEDRLTPPKYARYLAEAVPNARLEILDGAGHGLPSDRADEVAEHVASFLTEVGAC